jgi:PAS domain S-box-containing protein
VSKATEGATSVDDALGGVLRCLVDAGSVVGGIAYLYDDEEPGGVTAARAGLDEAAAAELRDALDPRTVRRMAESYVGPHLIREPPGSRQSILEDGGQHLRVISVPIASGDELLAQLILLRPAEGPSELDLGDDWHFYATLAQQTAASLLSIQATGELAAQVGFFDLMANTIPSPIFYQDVEGRFLGCNAAFEEYFGQSSGAVVGSSLEHILPSGAAAEHRRRDRDILTSGGPLTYESIFPGPDGQHRSAIVRKAPFRRAGGALGGIAGVILDITDRAEMEEALRKSEARIQAIYRTAPVGIALLALDGTYLTVNDRWCELTGYAQSELIGMRYQDVTHHEDLEASAFRFQKVVEGDLDHYEAEKRYVRRDGSIFWGTVSVAPITDASGEVVSLIATIADITQRREAEEALRLREAEAQHLASLLQDENERLKKEIDLAAKVQRSELPERCVAEGLEISHYFRPSGVVGGDFFGLLRSPTGASLAYLGDVSGHGLASALVMTMVVELMRDLLSPDRPPSEGLVRLQERLWERLDAMGHFVALTLCRYDPSEGLACCSSAGHPWPLLVGPDGVKPVRGEPGAPMGLFESYEYEDVCVDVPPGSTLVMYSDGFTEAHVRGGGRLGQDRFVQWCAGCGGRPADVGLATITGAFEEAVGDRALEDDATVMALRTIPMAVAQVAPEDEDLDALRGLVAKEAGERNWPSDVAEAIDRATLEAVAALKAADPGGPLRVAYGFTKDRFQASIGPSLPVSSAGGPRAQWPEVDLDPGRLAAVRASVDRVDWHPASGPSLIIERRL